MQHSPAREVLWVLLSSGFEPSDYSRRASLGGPTTVGPRMSEKATPKGLSILKFDHTTQVNNCFTILFRNTKYINIF